MKLNRTKLIELIDESKEDNTVTRKYICDIDTALSILKTYLEELSIQLCYKGESFIANNVQMVPNTVDTCFVNVNYNII